MISRKIFPSGLIIIGCNIYTGLSVLIPVDLIKCVIAQRVMQTCSLRNWRFKQNLCRFFGSWNCSGQNLQLPMWVNIFQRKWPKKLTKKGSVAINYSDRERQRKIFEFFLFTYQLFFNLEDSISFFAISISVRSHRRRSAFVLVAMVDVTHLHILTGVSNFQ